MFIFSRKSKKELTLKEVTSLLDGIITPITYVFTPINLNSEREKFFESETYNPQFKYKLVKNKNSDIFAKLANVEKISDVDPRISDFYIELIESKALVDQLYNGVGDNDAVTEFSIDRYGYPSYKLFKASSAILKRKVSKYALVSDEKVEKTRIVEHKEIVNIMKKVLNSFGLNDWSVIVSSREISKNIRVGVKEKEIVLGSDDISRRAMRLRKTIVHEIGTHVLRWYNGSLSGVPALTKSNIDGYYDVEEGLASYNEEMMGLMDYATLRQKAISSYAIYIGRDLSFRQLYNIMLSMFPKNTAFRITLRVKRGLGDTSLPGIYAKDVVYLRGYRMLRKKLALDTSLYDKLYAGKIGLKQVSWVDDGLIPKPKVTFEKDVFNQLFREFGI